MLAEMFGRKVAQRAEPDLSTRDTTCAGRLGEVFNTADDVTHQCSLMHVDLSLLPSVWSKPRWRYAQPHPRQLRQLTTTMAPPSRTVRLRQGKRRDTGAACLGCPGISTVSATPNA